MIRHRIEIASLMKSHCAVLTQKNNNKTKTKNKNSKHKNKSTMMKAWHDVEH